MLNESQVTSDAGENQSPMFQGIGNQFVINQSIIPPDETDPVQKNKALLYRVSTNAKWLLFALPTQPDAPTSSSAHRT
jgi:hypothetical protein